MITQHLMNRPVFGCLQRWSLRADDDRNRPATRVHSFRCRRVCRATISAGRCVPCHIAGTWLVSLLEDRRSDMIRWALRRAIDKFERTWNYDASYMRDMVEAS